MPGPTNTLLIEGSFRELVEEIADYIDNLRKPQQPNTDLPSLRTQVNPLLDVYSKAEEQSTGGEEDNDNVEECRDEVLKAVVDSSAILGAAPDKEFLAAYNLLIHLVQQSPNTNSYLQRICRNLTTGDAASSPARLTLSLSALTTIFNTLDADDPIRYPVFDATLQVIARNGNFDALRPQLKHIDSWLSSWQSSAAQTRRLFLNISRVANEAGDPQHGYDFLVKALRTVSASDAAGQEARDLSVQALRMALGSASHFDFEDLTSLDCVQALRQSEPVWFQLLEIFTSDGLDDFDAFRDVEHRGWLGQQKLDEEVLTRKMRLLTLASLAAGAGQARALPYGAIAEALKVPGEEVEMWVIDVIRAGLVEGKLSQLNQTFLIHRSTYRVFSENQWREVAGRLDMWRASLRGVLEVVRAEKEGLMLQKEAELRQMDSKVNGAGGGFRRGRNDMVDIGME